MSDKSISPFGRSYGGVHEFLSDDFLDYIAEVEKENLSSFMHSDLQQRSQEDQAELNRFAGTLNALRNGDNECVKTVDSGALSTPFGAFANDSGSPFHSLCAKDSCGILDLDMDHFSSATKETVALSDITNKPMGVWSDGQDMGVWSEHATVGPESIPEKSIYSPKVFIGGLPSDLTDESIAEFFSRFGEVTVDWPHRNYTHTNVPPNGYAFVLFKDAHNVDKLVSKCNNNSGNLSMMITRNEQQLKAVQVRPWKLINLNFVCKPGAINPRYAVFVGGVPRSITAAQLGALVYETFGEVSAVAIIVENGTQYPKGAAKVVFNTREAYTKAIALRFLVIKFAEQQKEMEVKPFLMESALCEGCHMESTSNLCAHLSCLVYLCDSCWYAHHVTRAFHHHTPMIKGGKNTSNPLKLSAQQSTSSPAPPLPPRQPTSRHNRHNGAGNKSSCFPPMVFPFPPPSSSSASRRSSFLS